MVGLYCVGLMRWCGCSLVCMICLMCWGLVLGLVFLCCMIWWLCNCWNWLVFGVGVVCMGMCGLLIVWLG